MKLFTCTACGNLIYFNNVCCTQCGATLGFLQDTQRLSAIVPAGDGLWQPVGDTRLYRMCNNYTGAGVCNWMLEAESEASHWADADYVVVNDDLDKATRQVRAILDAERIKRVRRTGLAEFVKKM